MSLKAGIIGLPNVGKSTLFHVLTSTEVDISNYPFCTIDSNVGVAQVEDERLEKLQPIYDSDEVVPAAIEFVDIAGLVKGAHKGEGLGNQFLANIREVDLIVHVVRSFPDKKIEHVEDDLDPCRDIETINTELIFKDLETIENRKEKVKKDAQGGKEDAKEELELIEKLEDLLNEGKFVYGYEPENDREEEIISSLFLLTNKPVVYVVNVRESGSIPEDLKAKFDEDDEEYISLNIKNEEDAMSLSKEERKELDLDESKVNELVQSVYNKLDLISFFTINPNEAHAWPLKGGSTAKEAAGVVHSDFQENFIKAKVVNCGKLVELGSIKKAREEGELKTAGSDYTVEDGDVLRIEHD